MCACLLFYYFFFVFFFVLLGANTRVEIGFLPPTDLMALSLVSVYVNQANVYFSFRYRLVSKLENESGTHKTERQNETRGQDEQKKT